jgi:hypothetical protein
VSDIRIDVRRNVQFLAMQTIARANFFLTKWDHDDVCFCTIYQYDPLDIHTAGKKTIPLVDMPLHWNTKFLLRVIKIKRY